MDKPFDRQVYDFLTGSGQHQVSSLAGGSRLRTLNWKALHVDTFSILERYWNGSAGHGPYVLIDPSDPNLLMPNQAGATSLFNDTRGWTTNTAFAGDGTLSSNAALGVTRHNIHNSRNLRWNFTVTPFEYPAIYFTSAYRNWPGIPIVPNLPYAFSSWCRPDGTVDSSIQIASKIHWLDANGGWLSETSGGDFVMTGWQRFSAVGVAPSNAVFARPLWVATGSTISVGASIYIDEPLFEQDTVVNDWASGTGLRPVDIVSFADNVPFNGRFRIGPQMSLRELAP
ncbi:MAG: hypothetical protein ABW022_11085 [Actinoplanes sp.]